MLPLARKIKIPVVRPELAAQFSLWRPGPLAPEEKYIIRTLERQRFSREPPLRIYSYRLEKPIEAKVA